MEEEKYDAVIVGAGFSGVYQLIELRKLGLRCKLMDAGSDFGGTWFWNRYPGARVDSHIPIYELSIPELWKEWAWTEKFPSQKELQAYFRYAGEKMELRPHCGFDTVVKQACWDDRLHLWHITAGEKAGLIKVAARHLILCTGSTTMPYIPNIRGRETFKGISCHTSRWPEEGIEMTGKRVGVIGTGASGVQIIQELGPQVSHLAVFQRTPNMALPMKQYEVSKEAQDHFKPIYNELYKKLTVSFFGSLSHPIPRSMRSDSKEEREANFEKMWSLGGFDFLVGNYQDILIDRISNGLAYKFWRKKVSERIKDPEKRALLAPEVQPHPMGAKRQSLELNYYEVFNQDNVDLVDLKATRILEINANGVKTSDKEYEFDVIIFATGFDNYDGSFRGIDLRGVNEKTIQEHWKDGALTYLGMTIDQFPNLFFVYGPQGPTSFCNAPACIEIQGAWVTQTIAYLREHRITKFTPTSQAALEFKKHVNDLCVGTLISEADSWYVGANIPGKKREVYNYFGGVVAYRQEIQQEMERGYPSFMRETLDESISRARL